MLFWLVASIVLISALAVIILPNPLYSALCLATNLVAVAALYAMLGAHFLAAVQITVYAGAIMVLVVFVIMLLNFKHESFGLSDFFIFIVGLLTSAASAFLLSTGFNSLFAGTKLYGEKTGFGTKEIGIELFKETPLLFQLAGVLLLTALIGSVLLANQRRVIKIKS
jgi:NADH-quinone oxidoreductase subunit J